MKTYTFHANGMHCKSCSLVIEQELSDLSYVKKVHANSSTQVVTVTGDFDGVPQESLATDFSSLLSQHGYSLSIQKDEVKKSWADFKLAIPLAVAFALLFVLLQKIGLINLISSKNVSYGTAFIVGIVASLSTCMAVVGGLVLSMSSTFSKNGKNTKPQILFHAGRLISFFVLGGVIGLLGARFSLGTNSTFALSFIIAIVMIILGLNLLDFHFARKLQPSMPKFLSKHALGVSKINHTFTPFIVGVATFFLPCGFTQSMQIYTLSTGSFFAGAMTMFVFALGTLPVLALVSFSSLSVSNSKWSGVFFKTAGIIVIMFALFNIINGLVIINVIPPIFNF